MNAPATYTGHVTLREGNPSNYLEGLNPQNWSTNASQLWGASFLVGDPAARRSKQAMLLGSRADEPPSAGYRDAWGLPDPGVFYEDVRILGFRYRNVLQTSFEIDPPLATGKPVKSFHFKYCQLDCLTTESAVGLVDGGIDVDHGYSLCRSIVDAEYGRAVYVEISKTVRFTEPAYLEDDIGALSDVLVPLIFDGWLHQLIFNE